MIRASLRRIAISPQRLLGITCLPAYTLRWNSSLSSSEPKQFKRSTLPSASTPLSSSYPTDVKDTLKVELSGSKNAEFASHMDDLKATKCINPLVSDHNELPLLLSITERASSKLQNLIQTDKIPNAALKIKVESGGCHGFQYDLKLIDDYTELFNPDEDETMFVRDGVARVIIDKTSLEILRDSKVDYVHELIGSQFKVVDSPYTSSSCGCGSSFDFDFDKLNETTN